MAAGGRRFLLAQGRWAPGDATGADGLSVYLPVFKSGRLVKEKFCAFCLKEKCSPLVQAFMSTLAEVFTES